MHKKKYKEEANKMKGHDVWKENSLWDKLYDQKLRSNSWFWEMKSAIDWNLQAIEMETHTTVLIGSRCCDNSNTAKNMICSS